MGKRFYVKVLPILGALLLLSACKPNARIKGHLANADNELLTLRINTSPPVMIDTLRLGRDGAFSFRYNFPDAYPAFLTLSTKRHTVATLLVERGETVGLEADADQAGKYTVTGSEGSALVKELNDRLLATSASFDSLSRIAQRFDSQSDVEAVRRINLEIGNLFVKYKQYLIRFIIKNSKSYAAYMAMYQSMPNGFMLFGKEQDAIYFKTLADSLSARYPHSPYASKLCEDYERLIKSINLQNMLDKATEVSGMPNIVLPDPDGRPVALADLRGKVVLLAFWASWDKGSVLDNMELLDSYLKYRDRGFEIYQVSLDRSMEDWKRTISDQGLPWINVSDLRGVDSYAARLYNIKKLPSNFLLSKQGELLGKDVMGKTLEGKIEEGLRNRAD